jgi:two-component system cell cycle sensor histidine kinase/response regulator CckA
MNHLFEPFFTTKELGRGTGLGLSTVYGIVTQSRGIITVESQPGEGTAFRIYLPRVGNLASAAAAQVAIMPHGTETILLAEDDAAVRKVVASSLSRCGFAVLAACDAAEAMTIAVGHTGPIHLLLTDVVMPNGRGDDLARRYRAERSDIPVLFMSGYTDTAKIFGEDHLDRTDFVQKPFTIMELTTRVRALLDGAPLEHV